MKIRVYKTELERRYIANEIARENVINDANGAPVIQRSTPTEFEIIYNVAYGVLCEMCFRYEARNNDDIVQSLINAAEYTLKQFLPQCNCYHTIYLPLQDTVDFWETEEI